MATTAPNSSFIAEAPGRTAPLPVPALWKRFALVPLAVGFCYLYPWHPLRAYTADWNIWIDLLLGMHLLRVSAEQVVWNGVLYRYDVACTMIDVWFGSIPLLWNTRRSVIQNFGLLAGFGAGLFVFNIFRLSLSDLIFSRSVPWDLAHNVMSGVSYFVVWMWLWKNRYSPLREYRTSHAAAGDLASQLS